jgi:hypothetical protein
MQCAILPNFERQNKPRKKTFHNLTPNLPGILNTDQERLPQKKVSFIGGGLLPKDSYDIKISLNESLGQREVTHKKSINLLKLDQKSTSDTPKSKSRIQSSRLGKQIATLEKNLDTMSGNERDKSKNKLVNLNELMLPKIEVNETRNIRKSDSKQIRFSLEQAYTAELTTASDFMIPKTTKANESQKTRFSLFNKAVPKQKVNFNKTEYKSNSSLFFKDKKLKDMKVLVNKQYGSYMVKCNELKDYIQTRYEKLEEITFEK